MKVVTFNVCGIRNLFEFKPWNQNRDLSSVFESWDASIVCFQETKLQSQDLKREWAIVPGYTSFFTFSSSKKGYSGVCVYVKNEIPVLAAEEGISGWLPDLSKNGNIYRESQQNIGGYPDILSNLGREVDSEGRALVIDIGSAVLIGLYCPCNSTGENSEFREIFFEILDQRVRNLREAGRKVVILGDINVSPQLQDSAMAQQELKKDPEVRTQFESSAQRQIVRSWIDDLKFQDTTRGLHPDRERMYTCWDIRVDGRGANFGSRIDLILASSDIECSGGDIMGDVYGSDHCPVFADLLLARAEKPADYLVPILSRKRTAIFAGIQSFWGGPGVSQGSRPTSVQPSAAKLATTKISTSKPSIKSQESKVSKSKLSKGVTAFFTKLPRDSSEVDDVSKQASFQIAIEEPVTPPNNQSKQAWKDIFTVTKPVCYHKEECKLQKSSKAGPNKGRSFWSCQRPQGEQGDFKFRCKFFKWA